MIDLILGAVIALAAIGGALLGMKRVLPLIGFAAGAVLGTRVPVLVLEDGLRSDYALLVALPSALVLGALLAAVVERFAASGARSRRARPVRSRRALDGVGGGVLGACAAVVTVWMIAPAATEVRSLRDGVDDSQLLARLNSVLEPANPTRVDETSVAGNLPEFSGPAPDVPLGDAAILSDPDVAKAERSVVSVATVGCDGAGGSGSGWIAADGIVATNAHVVGGAVTIIVQRGGTGAHLAAVPIWFDGEHDIALLRVNELRGARVLPMVREAAGGTSGATLGFPLGRKAVRRARIGATTSRITGSLGGRPPPGVSYDLAGRELVEIRGRSQPGNSGGPVVDAKGRVLTTVFAGGFGSSTLGVPNRIVRAGLRRAKSRVRLPDTDCERGPDEEDVASPLGAPSAG